MTAPSAPRRFSFPDPSVGAIVLGFGGVVGVATGKLVAALILAAPVSLVAVVLDRRWRRQGRERADA